jgi:drug/metabolite transporter (DMT)-like permease
VTSLAFAGVVVIGGTNLVAVRYTNEYVPPFMGSALRFGVAGVALLVVATVRKVPRPRQGELTGTVLYGLLAFGGAMGFGYWGLQQIPAGVAGVIFASVPVLTLLLAMVHGLERVGPRALIGAVFTVLGVAVLVGDSTAGSLPLRPSLSMVASAVCLAEAGIVIKKFPPCHAIASNGLAMTIGAVVVLGVSLLTQETWSLPSRAGVWLAMAYLIVVGSIGLFWLYLLVLERWAASQASYQFVIIPFVATLMAASLLSERISGRFAIGGAVVLAGVIIGALSTGANPVPASDQQEAQAQRCAII